eukprot:GHVS01010882.1.p1 GENE.GHVS01010882.1~~GHVS01010882.1.p1  ORF type:complete len:325 (+),score=63.12 GHVS01010882.1:68-1042(+)
MSEVDFHRSYRDVSAGEFRYMVDGVAAGTRADGRDCLQCRPARVQLGVVPSAAGSAEVLTEDTDLLVAVKCQVVTPESNGSQTLPPADEGDLRVHVECSPSVALKEHHRAGMEGVVPVEGMGYELSKLAEDLCLGRSAVDRKKLCVVPGRLFWRVWIDVSVMNAGGNLVDLVSIGIRAALSNTVLPMIYMEEKVDGKKRRPQREEESEVAWYDDQPVDELMRRFQVDDRPTVGLRMDVREMPVCVSVGSIGNRFVWDMTKEESRCADVKLTVAVNGRGECAGIFKSGGGVVEMDGLLTIMEGSLNTGKDIIAMLDRIAAEYKLR